MYLIFSWEPHMQVYNYFFPVNLFYDILTFRPPKEPQRAEETLSSLTPIFWTYFMSSWVCWSSIILAESEEEWKSLLMKVKESEKVGLNSTFRKLRSWHLLPSLHGQIDGETMEIVTDFLLGGSKITADGDGSHEIKRWLLLGRKVMTKLDRILKSRDITLPTKVCLVKAMVFPYKSWTIKKKLRAKELMLLNCGVEDSWEFLGLQGDPTSQS